MIMLVITEKYKKERKIKMNIKQYTINENLARMAKEMRSFSDYIPNTATNGYINILNQFSDAVDHLLERHSVTDEQMESIEYYADRYSKKLADLINKENHINTMCPSVMIAGASNFPVRKKQKQNAAYDKLMREQGELLSPTNNYYFKKIKNIITNKNIYSNDEFAIEKLQNKLSDLKQKHEEMKAQNAYYRKHGTMKGYECMSDEEAERIDLKIKDAFYWNKQPYPSYHLSGNNAEIKRISARIEELTRLKEDAEKPTEEKYPLIDGVKIVENAEAMRIQLIFDEKPDDETRSLLKSNGFRWSPHFSAWQRQLTGNGITATQNLLKTINERNN